MSAARRRSAALALVVLGACATPKQKTLWDTDCGVPRDPRVSPNPKLRDLLHADRAILAFRVGACRDEASVCDYSAEFCDEKFCFGSCTRVSEFPPEVRERALAGELARLRRLEPAEVAAAPRLVARLRALPECTQPCQQEVDHHVARLKAASAKPAPPPVTRDPKVDQAFRDFWSKQPHR